MRLYLILGVSAAIIATAILMFFSVGFDNMPLMIVTFIIMLISIGALMMTLRQVRDVKDGLPMEDERSKKVMQKAMSTSFLLMIYLLLAVGFVTDRVDIEPRHVSSIGILGGAVFFFVSWFYYNWRGTF